MRNLSRWIAPALIGLAACGSQSDDAGRKKLSERERDSVISTMPIPGAKSVRRALTASDLEAGHTALIDSASQ